MMYFNLFSEYLNKGGSIINLYYPFGIIIVIVTNLLVTRIFKVNELDKRILSLMIGILMIISIPYTMDMYYQTEAYDKLWGTVESSKLRLSTEDEDIINIRKEWLKVGETDIDIEKGHVSEDTNQSIFRVNRDYIIYDQYQKSIVNSMSYSEVYNLFSEFYNSDTSLNYENYGEIGEHSYSAFGLLIGCEKYDYHLDLIPENGQFKVVPQHLIDLDLKTIY